MECPYYKRECFPTEEEEEEYCWGNCEECPWYHIFSRMEEEADVEGFLEETIEEEW